MATESGHYREAEDLVLKAQTTSRGPKVERWYTDTATVHALLAIADSLDALLRRLGPPDNDGTLLLINEMADDGRIVDGADKLRDALGVKDGGQ